MIHWKEEDHSYCWNAQKTYSLVARDRKMFWKFYNFQKIAHFSVFWCPCSIILIGKKLFRMHTVHLNNIYHHIFGLNAFMTCLRHSKKFEKNLKKFWIFSILGSHSLNRWRTSLVYGGGQLYLNLFELKFCVNTGQYDPNKYLKRVSSDLEGVSAKKKFSKKMFPEIFQTFWNFVLLFDFIFA